VGVSPLWPTENSGLTPAAGLVLLPGAVLPVGYDSNRDISTACHDWNRNPQASGCLSLHEAMASLESFSIDSRVISRQIGRFAWFFEET
jgi:hypothetical protein